ncbi:hypothetical protein PENTCL1PPCAC_25154, partial [Pristionchus entomophagus]
MLYESDRSNVQLIVIIDWQSFTIGNALFDISLLCAISLTPEVRKTNEHALVEFYWREMQQKCAAKGTSFIIDLDTARKLYPHCLQWGAVVLAMMVFLRRLVAAEPDEIREDGPLIARLRAILEDITE